MKFAFPMPHILRLKAMLQPWEERVTGADQTRLAKLADELGYDMLAFGEHIVVPREHVELSGPHYFHSAAGMGYYAGATQRIRVNCTLAILPLHNPLVLAKALATIDWMSSGRVDVTFGVGWLEREFEIMGVPFHERGRISEEYVAAMIELWTKDDPVFEGKYVSFRDIAFEPKPVQKPHLPIWFGGDSDAALKRTARYGSGWVPWLTKPADIAARIDFIKSQPDYKGGPFEVCYGLATSRVGEGHSVNENPDARPGMSAQEIIDKLGQLKDQGVTMSSIPIPAVKDIEAYADYARWVIEEIKPKVQ